MHVLHVLTSIAHEFTQVQQQLAKLQMNLEKVHENYSIIAQMREAAEADLAQVMCFAGMQACFITKVTSDCCFRSGQRTSNS